MDFAQDSKHTSLSNSLMVSRLAIPTAFPSFTMETHNTVSIVYSNNRPISIDMVSNNPDESNSSKTLH